jgi:hypothetical protein
MLDLFSRHSQASNRPNYPMGILLRQAKNARAFPPDLLPACTPCLSFAFLTAACPIQDKGSSPITVTAQLEIYSYIYSTRVNPFPRLDSELLHPTPSLA